MSRYMQDNSAAFFATGNVALSRRLLLKAGSLLKGVSEGPFDADFSEYGWEDLELGGKNKNSNSKLMLCIRQNIKMNRLVYLSVYTTYSI